MFHLIPSRRTGLLVGFVIGVFWCGAPAAHAALPAGNLLTNGDAEQGAAAGDGVVPSLGVAPPIGWTTASDVSQVRYNQGGFPANDEADPDTLGGLAFFAGGPSISGGTRTMSQELTLDAAAIDEIQDGDVTATLTADLGGYESQPDHAGVAVSFGIDSSHITTTRSIDPVNYIDRGSATKLLRRTVTLDPVPADITYIKVEVTFSSPNAGYIDGYADNITLTLSEPAPPDTTPPQTTITLSPTGEGDLTPPVTVSASASDPAPGSGVAETRCVLDPATAPTTFADLPAACSIGPVSAPGSHTVYAGSADVAGNVESPVIARSFSVASPPPGPQVPDTTITGGPAGDTWEAAPAFGFGSTIEGSSFSCRHDGGRWIDCQSGYYATLTPGSHTFEVKARSPQGAEDPTPASRAFKVLAPDSYGYSCVRKNLDYHAAFLDEDRDEGCFAIFRGLYDCTPAAGQAPDAKCDERGCPWGYACGQERLVQCPLGAKCTLITRARYGSDDASDAGADVLSEFLAPRLRIDRDYLPQVPFGYGAGRCRKDFHGDGCTATATATRLGAGEWMQSSCIQRFPQMSQKTPGITALRRIECRAEVKIEPAKPINPVAVGTGMQLYGPGPGVLSVIAGSVKPSAAAGSPLVAAIRRVLTKAGPVTLKPKLSRAAKRKLRRKGKLTLPVEATFTPNEGEPITRSARIQIRRTRP